MRQIQLEITLHEEFKDKKEIVGRKVCWRTQGDWRAKKNSTTYNRKKTILSRTPDKWNVKYRKKSKQYNVETDNKIDLEETANRNHLH